MPLRVLQHVITFFKPPTFEDAEKSYAAVLLNLILILLLVVTIPGLISVLVDPALYYSLPIVILATAAILCTRAMMRRGHVKAASHFLVWGLWLVITLSCFSDTGLYSVALAGYSLIIVCAGLLLSGPAALMAGALSMLATLGMLIAFNAGYLQPQGDYFNYAFSVWIIYGMIFSVIAVLMWTAAKIILTALIHTQRQNFALAREIIERRQVETYLNNFWELSMDGVVIATPDGYFQRVNPTFEKLLGYASGELNGRYFLDLVYPDDRPDTRDAIQTQINGLAVTNFENRYYCKDRVLKWISWSSRMVDGVIYAVARDVTEHKRADEALRESEERLRLTTEAADIVLWRLDFQAQMIYVSQGQGGAPGRTVPYADFLSRVHPEDRTAVEEAVQHAIDQDADYQVEYRAIFAPSQEYRWSTARGRIVRDAQGTPTHLLGVSLEIHERKQAQEQQTALTIAQERTEFLTQFLSEIGEITHDLKAPLSVINTSLYFLERPLDGDAKHQRILRIQEQTSILQKYIQNILMISRLERGDELQHTAVDLNLLVRNAVDSFRAQIDNKQLELRFDLIQDLGTVSGDETQLYRAIANLIENAANYTPEGGTITLRTRVDGHAAILEVQDTGVGIDPTEQPHIFERFYRGKEVRISMQNGTGLGLAIVRKIAELHGGTVDVESAPGQGSTFRIRLPLSQETMRLY